MGTVKDKAKALSLLSQLKSNYPYDKTSVEYGYEHGYVEAVNNACEWLLQNLQYQDPAHFNYDMEKMYSEFVEDFIEAMYND